MKAFISIDMEGICGVVREIGTHPTKGGQGYQRRRRLMTQEGNAAIEGCLKAGATEVLIADSHWNFDNLIPEELHEAATLLRGTPRGFAMMQDLDGSYDAALFIGYHARAGTPRAILDDTYSGTIGGVRVNGTEVGETGINAYLAGHHGVPVVLVTGDWAVTAEAKALSPNVHTVAGKDATGATSARNLHPKKAREQIRAEATEAVRAAKTIRALVAKTTLQVGGEEGQEERLVLLPGRGTREEDSRNHRERRRAERRSARAQQDPDRGLLEGLEALQQDQRALRPRALVHKLGRVPGHLPGRRL